MGTLLGNGELRIQVVGALGAYVLLNLALTLLFVWLTLDAAAAATRFQQGQTALSVAENLGHQFSSLEQSLAGAVRMDDLIRLDPVGGRRLLSQLRLSSPFLGAFTAFDLDGLQKLRVTVRDSLPGLPDRFVGPDLIRTILQGRPVRSALWWSDDFPYQALAVPLLDKSLHVTGVLVATAEISALWPVIRAMGEYEKSQVYVTDEEGRLLLTRDFTLKKNTVPVLVSGILAGTPPQGLYQGLEGSPVLGSWARVKDSQWIVAAEISGAWAESSFQALYWMMGFQLLLGLAAGLVFGLFLEKRVVGPLVQISSQAAQYGEGRFEKSLEVRAGAEITTLAGSLNRMASQLSGLIGQLEERVEERTRELVEARNEVQRSFLELQMTQRHLIEADRMASLGKLVAGVAHEINTPVGNALTVSSFLSNQSRVLKDRVSRHSLDEESFQTFLDDLGEASRIIEQNLTRAADLITSFKQVAVNQTAGEAQDFELHALLQDLALSFQHDLRVRGHRIDIDCPPDLRPVTRQGLLIQVLTNLVQNSIVHGFEGRRDGRISITARTEGPDLVLDYRDNGCGIPPELHAKIFEPFFTTRREAGGTGLGLSIVHNIVAGPLGGRLTFDSLPGEGVHFRFFLPLEEASRTQEVPP